MTTNKNCKPVNGDDRGGIEFLIKVVEFFAGLFKP